MGSELNMIPKKDQVRLIRAFLSGLFPEGYCDGPRVDMREHYPPRFRIEWHGNRLDLAYQFAHQGNGELALAFALGLCHRFGFKRAGWSSVGYCASMREFLQCRPFGQIEEADLSQDPSLPGRVQLLLRDSREYWKSARKAYEEFVAELLANH